MKRFSLLSFWLLLVGFSNAKEIDINPKVSLLNQITSSSSCYVIRDAVDLHGDTLILPEKVRIKFVENGHLLNGVIVGTNSKIEAGKSVIFDKSISISGTRVNKHVYSDWIKFPDGKSPSNKCFSILCNLCRGPHLTHLYTSEFTCYVDGNQNEGSIVVSSNAYWHNRTTIIMLPNSYTKYDIVRLTKAENVTIEGGRFIGDCDEHAGNKGEWGHGINVSGCTNVKLLNLQCEFCFGDGIDLVEAYTNNVPDIYCDSITISNVKCLHNRRQGLSIEAAHNVCVKNSEFAFTGNPQYTAPGAGIDIEPWEKSNVKIKNIKIQNCNLHDNKGFDLKIQPNHMYGKQYSEYDASVNIIDCKV